MADDETKKTDVLNLRLDPALAAEIQRIAEWRANRPLSEIARELMRHGVTVERQLEAQELHRPYEHARIERDPDRGLPEDRGSVGLVHAQRAGGDGRRGRAERIGIASDRAPLQGKRNSRSFLR